MADSRNDRLMGLPEVIFEKIFRELDLPNQRSLYRAYRNHNEATGLEYVQAHKMSTSCWVCMLQIYMDMFWEIGGRKIDGSGGSFFSKFENEPALGSKGFNILYKYAGEQGNKSYFIQRKLWDLNDMKESDAIFYEFQRKIQNVFKAKDVQSLRSHLDSAHRTDYYLPKNFFNELSAKIGKF